MSNESKGNGSDSGQYLLPENDKRFSWKQNDTELTPERRTALGDFASGFNLPAPQIPAEELQSAFIHRSFRTESTTDDDNERLEFLGDSVIALATTEYLLEMYPESSEGWMSKLRASVVSRAVLGEVGKAMNIGNLMLLGAGEERSGGRQRSSIIGSALEAVCGVLYLHYKWEDLREPLRLNIVIPALNIVRRNHLVDYKSQLQEFTQKEHQAIPLYVVVQEAGPDHLKTFEVEVRLEDKTLGTGKGRRKKTAENEAAREALAQLGQLDKAT